MTRSMKRPAFGGLFHFRRPKLTGPGGGAWRTGSAMFHVGGTGVADLSAASASNLRNSLRSVVGVSKVPESLAKILRARPGLVKSMITKANARTFRIFG